jgi:hypothetical protein
VRCDRCGGLRVEDYFCGASPSDGVWDYEGFRCINCGAIAFPDVPIRIVDGSAHILVGGESD